MIHPIRISGLLWASGLLARNAGRRLKHADEKGECQTPNVSSIVIRPSSSRLQAGLMLKLDAFAHRKPYEASDGSAGHA